jgi:hypothetical protein
VLGFEGSIATSVATSLNTIVQVAPASFDRKTPDDEEAYRVMFGFALLRGSIAIRFT